MSDIFAFLSFTAKVAFVETGRALWWITIGEVFALLIGIVLLFVGWRLTKFVFSETKTADWCRRLLMVTWLVLITPVLGSAGFFWGVNVATEKTILAQELIEHAFQEALAIPIESGLARIEKLTSGSDAGEATEDSETLDEESTNTNDATLADEADSDPSPTLYSSTKLLEDLDSLEAGPLKRLMKEAGEKLNFDSSVIPDWLLTWVMHQAFGVVKGEGGLSLVEIMDKLREIVDDAKENDEDGDGLVSARQLAWSVGSTQGVPVLELYMGHTRKVLLIATAIQVLGIAGIATLVFWLANFLLDIAAAKVAETKRIRQPIRPAERSVADHSEACDVVPSQRDLRSDCSSDGSFNECSSQLADGFSPSVATRVMSSPLRSSKTSILSPTPNCLR